MNTKEAKQLKGAKAAVLAQWEKACFTQGIPSRSKFVVFSDDNADALEYNFLMQDFIQLRNRIGRNVARRENTAMYRNLGLKRAVGALGGVYFE